MNHSRVTSFIAGVISYLLLLGIIFADGLSTVWSIFYAPFPYFIPELRNPNSGLAGLHLFLFARLIRVIALPLSFWAIGKIAGLKLSMLIIFVGFLSTALLASLLKLIFGL